MFEKVAILTGTDISFPLIQALSNENKLTEVILSKTSAHLIGQVKPLISSGMARTAEDERHITLQEHCDLLIVMGYHFKIDRLRNATPAINIHFGPLPENRGADPIFWTLKQGKKLAYIAIHEITDTLDTGTIWKEKGIDILPGETWGILMNRLGVLTIPLVREVLIGNFEPRSQDETLAVYNPRPQPSDATINWHAMSASQIENLVNAGNPKYSGARTTILGNQINILEVSPARVNMPEDQPYPIPGTIVHSSSEHGLFVACKDQQFLKLNILMTPEGYISGHKLAAMGTPVGLQLGA